MSQLQGRGDQGLSVEILYNGARMKSIPQRMLNYPFDSPDDYEVELFVSTSYGCTDTILKAIHVRPTYSLEEGSSYYESFESGAAGWASSSDESPGKFLDLG